jgi:lipoate-protein ligase A
MTGARGTSWRLLVTEPLDGPTNMAIDEAVLRGRIAATAPPTVRFYGWTPATVSLGYAQPLEERMDRTRTRLGLGLVRRPTGGSAILHATPDGEVTYAVVARADDFPGAGDVLETYRVLGAGLAAGLVRLGARVELVPLVRGRGAGAPPRFCFARTGAYELAISGKKVAGSAQRRQGGAFLQHGSILLDLDPARVRAVFPEDEDPLRAVTTLGTTLGRRVGFDEAVAALAPALGEALGGPLAPGGLTEAEAGLAERLVATKYGTDAWTRFGRAPARHEDRPVPALR